MRNCLTVFLVIVSCLGCGNDPPQGIAKLQGEVASLDGFWVMDVGQAACAIPPGFLDALDGTEGFNVTQNGDQLTADFIDGAGNHVVLDATLQADNRVVGTVTITVDAPAPLLTGNGSAACTGKGYVVNNFDNTVSVIDLQTGAEVDVITVGGNPRGLDITPDGALVFVANRGDNTVSVIRTSDDTVIATIQLTGTGEPYNVEVSPDGSTVYVVNKTIGGGGAGTSDVSVIDVASRAEVRTITLDGTSPEGLAISPDGARVYVVCRESETVDVISTATPSVTTSGIAAPSHPRDATFLPDGSKAYVVGEGGLFVLEGDPAQLGQIPSVTGVDGRDVVASPDGTRIYVAGGPFTGRVYVVDTSTDQLIDTIQLTTGGAYGIDLCGNGRYAYVSDDSGAVAVVDLLSGAQIDTITVGSAPKWIKLFEIIPRTAVLAFDAVAALNTVDRQLDGTMLVTSDSGDGSPCADELIAFWILVTNPS